MPGTPIALVRSALRAIIPRSAFRFPRSEVRSVTLAARCTTFAARCVHLRRTTEPRRHREIREGINNGSSSMPSSPSVPSSLLRVSEPRWFSSHWWGKPHPTHSFHPSSRAKRGISCCSITRDSSLAVGMTATRSMSSLRVSEPRWFNVRSLTLAARKDAITARRALDNVGRPNSIPPSLPHSDF
jgi:hypothetical protein